MARRSSKPTKRDWRWYASLALNGAVALSMVLGTVFLFTGAPTPRATVPTLEVPTAAPTVAPSGATPVPTVAPPTPTPKASAQDYTFAVVGDSRDGDVVYSRILKMVQADGSAFLIHLGDLVPTGEEANWLNFQKLTFSPDTSIVTKKRCEHDDTRGKSRRIKRTRRMDPSFGF